jgi:hypothetical protein
MTRAAVLLMVFIASATAQAAESMPSTAVLAEMGLGKLQVLSDREASVIRGRGFEPGSQLAGFESYQQSIADFKEHVADFRERIKGHTFAGTERFKKSKDNFQKHVTKFRDAVCDFKHKVH